MPRDAKREAEELRRLRLGFGLTQVQLAHLIDVGPATYQRYERGVNLAPFAVIELMRCWAREEAQGKRSMKLTKKKT
jgi:transcriptional regulator with XRE-family HTH domain